MENKQNKYEIKVLAKVGSCDNILFEKMAQKSDLTSTKLSNLIGSVVKIVGYAQCEIEINDKIFIMNYIDTEEYGLISTGSEIFMDSVTDYYGEVENVRLKEIKTKKGKTYKAVPVFQSKNETATEE